MTNEPRSPANEHDATDAGRDAMSETQITLHEKLCAYILGEANDDERAEVERALTMSAELRAERESLEATIGLVRNSMSKSETLSPEATAGVLSRATVKKSRPWYFSMPMRIAAGIVALTIAYALYESHDWRSTAERVAGLDSSSRRALGSAADSSLLAKAEQPAARLPAAPEASSMPPSEKDLLASAESRVDRPADFVKARPDGDDATISNETIAHNAFARRPPNGNAARDEELPEVIDRADANRGVNEAAEIVDSQAVGVGMSARPLADKKTETYRGAGDSVPPGASGASTGGASGPSGGVASGSAGSQANTPLGASSQAPTSVGMRRLGTGVSHYGSTAARAAGPSSTRAGAEPLRQLGYTTDGATSAPQALRGLGYASGGDALARDPELEKYWPESPKYHEMLERLAQRNLTPQERDQLLDSQCRYILNRCRSQPNERPRDMYFRFWGDNAFQLALLEPQSTFSADVDTASYALARRYINEGQLPEKAQVRTEEFVNYFKPDVAAPREGTFAIQTELAPSRFSNDANRTMLRVVVRGREVTKQERKPLALTFVIDCSGSMIEQNRLEMVKHAIRLLLTQLDGNDSIAIVAFSSDARMILPMTSASRRDLIESALQPLKPENSTNSEAGLKMGYEAALAGLNANANNRVVFLSDGVANVGETDPQKLAEGVKRIREKGIYLNSIGVGMNNHNDALLEQLADKGDGVCNYIDSEDEAKRVMVDNFTGAMETIARDVKIQVEFDPARVERYRLLGYENRFIANKDFRNDKIDAGEVGAGHQVCALYELELANSGAQDVAQKPLATVRLRWKAPRDVKRPDANEEASEIERPVLASSMTSYEGASFGYKRAVIVAQFAEFLRRSSHARGRSFDDLIAEAQKLEKQGDDRDVAELVTLLEKSRSLILASLPQCDELCQTIDVIRKNQILRAEHDMLSLERDQKTLDELAKQNAELEARIRELLRRKLEAKSK
jgi:Ca-activated chloride channel family protein